MRVLSILALLQATLAGVPVAVRNLGKEIVIVRSRCSAVLGTAEAHPAAGQTVDEGRDVHRLVCHPRVHRLRRGRKNFQSKGRRPFESCESAGLCWGGTANPGICW